MAISLYQKYRPSKFSEVIGHDSIKSILTNSIKNDRVAHAYLFSGPRGTGKTSFARLIAKAVNCLEPENGDACGKCQVCKSIQESKFLDLIEIDAASNRGIDEIRQLKERVNFAPFEGRKKVYIIDEVHMLTNEAFNALLKTLEEPPDFVIFILATTEPHKIPMTILSRVQRFDLKLAKKDQLFTKLKLIAKSEGLRITDSALEKLYSLSGGSYRDSESLLAKLLSSKLQKENEVSIKDLEKCFSLISADSVEILSDLILTSQVEEALKFVDKLVEEGFSIDQLIFQLLECFRRLIREYYRAGNDQRYELRTIVEAISIFVDASVKVKDAMIVSLPLEIAIFQMAKSPKVEHKLPPSPRVSDVVTKKDETIDLPKEIVQKTLKKEIKSIEKSEGSQILSIDEINAKWQDFLASAKQFNHNLCAFLVSGKVQKIEGNELTFEVGYKFHKQKIESLKSKEVLSSISKKIFGQSLIFKCIINPDLINKDGFDKEGEDSNENLVEEVFSDL